MNNLLVDKEAIRLKYLKEFGVNVSTNKFEISTLSKREYINWLGAIVSECIRRNLVPIL